MPAVSDHAQGRVQAAGKLESVGDRELAVACAPEDECRAAQLSEVLPDVVDDDRAGGADRVGGQPRAFQETVDGGTGKDQRVGGAPSTEDEVAKKRALRDRVGPRGNEPARTDDPEDA